MSRRTMYFHHNYWIFALLVLALVAVISLIFLRVVGLAFESVGFGPITTALILIGTLLGSVINIPLLKLKATVPVVKEEFVSFFGVVYRIPRMEYGETTTVLAINVGGALIPTVVSFYLLWKASSAPSAPSVILYCLVGVAIVALVTHAVSRPIKGIGIATPIFIPPLIAALIAYVLPTGLPKVVAYVAGVLGTLIGADLMNLSVIPRLGAPMASIGGAGTFDGVFLTGIIAVLLA